MLTWLLKEWCSQLYKMSNHQYGNTLVSPRKKKKLRVGKMQISTSIPQLKTLLPQRTAFDGGCLLRSSPSGPGATELLSDLCRPLQLQAGRFPTAARVHPTLPSLPSSHRRQASAGPDQRCAPTAPTPAPSGPSARLSPASPTALPAPLTVPEQGGPCIPSPGPRVGGGFGDPRWHSGPADPAPPPPALPSGPRRQQGRAGHRPFPRRSGSRTPAAPPRSAGPHRQLPAPRLPRGGRA